MPPPFSSATPVAFRLLPAAGGGLEPASPAAPLHSQKKLAPPAVRAVELCDLPSVLMNLVLLAADGSACSYKFAVENFEVIPGAFTLRH